LSSISQYSITYIYYDFWNYNIHILQKRGLGYIRNVTFINSRAIEDIMNSNMDSNKQKLETKQLPSEFEQLNNECKGKVKGLEREIEQVASEYIPKMHNVLKDAGFPIYDARETVEE
jgi:cysteinyl-tRNA synthetase